LIRKLVGGKLKLKNGKRRIVTTDFTD